MDYRLLFSTFAIFFTTFDNIRWPNPTLAGWVSNGCLLLFVLLNYRMFKGILEPKYSVINICALMIGGLIVFSGYANADMSYDAIVWDVRTTDIQTLKAMRPDHAMYAALRFVSILLYIQYLNNLGKSKLFLRYFFAMFLVYTAVADINAILTGSDDADGYLVGNKFNVSYNNLLLNALYFLRNPQLTADKSARLKLKLLFLLSLVVSVKTECTTAVVGTVCLYVLTFNFKEAWRAKLYTWQTYTFLLIVCDVLFFFFTAAFIENPIMKFFIVDVLGEDMTLTGRLGIYAALSELLLECPLWGYGLGNAHLYTVMSGIGSNAQNGLFNLMLEVGILGCIMFFFMTTKMLKVASSNRNSYPVVCLMYTMLFLSSIEITFTIMLIIMNMFVLLEYKPKTVRMLQCQSVEAQMLKQANDP